MKHKRIKESMRRTLYAKFLLVLFFTSNLKMLAYPGGPTQPEAESFKPIGVSEHVNHFSGAFSYTIPLMDVDGFPINLNYTGSPSLDGDASWVGLGWDLNLGSVNRQMRGLPDEFDGSDTMVKEYKVKPNTTYGVKFNFNIQLANFEKLKRSLGLGLGYGIYFNNYRGMKTEISVTPSFNSTKEISDDKTSGAKGKTGVKINPSIGITSSSESGLSITPGVSMSLQNKLNDKRERNLGGANLGLPISAREGVKGLSYGFNVNAKGIKTMRDGKGGWAKGEYDKTAFAGGGSISFAGPSTPPFVQNPMINESYAFSLNGGGDLFTVDLGVGALGNYTINKVSQEVISRPLFGYFYSEKGKNNEIGILDFEREKDIPYQENVPIIGIPQANYDLFSVNQPTGSTQFRAYRTTSAIYKDPTVENTTFDGSLGGEIHGGGIFEGGATITTNWGGTTSKKWVNSFGSTGDFQTYDINSPLKEAYIIKSQNELTPTNDELYLNLRKEQPINVSHFGSGPGFYDNGNVNQFFTYPRTPIEPNYSNLDNSKKFNRGAIFSFLTTEERRGVGLDKTITDMPLGTNRLTTSSKYKSTHISEINVTNLDGTRAVYGLPLYNNFSREVNFSVDKQGSYNNGFMAYSNEASRSNSRGTEALYSSEKMPSYPHTWMLTGLLSPDYADLTGDGITDDDRGNAHKINYSLKNPNYVYRMPASNSGSVATYNPGLESDFKDDKASFSEGSREEWYVYSVESKNKIAFFMLSARQDAKGSNEIVGGINNISYKYRIDSIRLYSKADWLKNGVNAEVIKSVHFKYNYNSCIGAPGASSGKLTLESLYFKYGKSARSSANSYQFEYNNDAYYNYAAKEVDRWGNFKKSNQNPNGLGNHDFPYSTQNKTHADKNAAAWLLKKIVLPSGGQIEVDYESHTYGFVQNKRAAYMTTILGFSNSPTGTISNKLYETVRNNLGNVINSQNRNYLFFKFETGFIPKTVEEMKSMYFYDDQNLEFQNNLYYRCKVNLASRGGTMFKEYIPGYAGVHNMGIYAGDNTIGWIELKEVEESQPVAFSAWQFLKSSNPKLAYPYNDAEYSGMVAAITGMASFMGNIREMLAGYRDVATGYDIAKTVETDKCYIRLLKPDLIKYGGGARVAKIQIKDNWNAMSGSGKTNTYGQVYKYQSIYKGDTISSGVAEYEPLMGSDENPFKKPINYAGAKGLLAPTSLYYVDEPIGENFYPSPSIGYSQVLVRSLHSDPTKVNGSGHQEYNYYTAKDFPVKTSRTNLGGPNLKEESPPFFASFIKVFNHSAVFASQGFVVEVNDMHGKPKSEKTFNQKGFVISETNYKYLVDDENKTMPNLVNEVPTIDVNNNIQNTLMGVNFDFFNDMRQSKTISKEFSTEIGGGMFPLGFLPGFFVAPLGTFGITSQEYRSAATMKYIHKKGILRRTEKMQDGSKIVTENKLWDRNTGEVLLTTVQNEFNDPIYSLKMPAFWRYEGMSFGYKNLGTSFLIKQDDNLGTLKDLNTTSNMMNILYPGDEVEYAKIFPLLPNEKIEYKKYWVVKDFASSHKFLINQYGEKLIKPANATIPITMGLVKVIRSGRRNLISSPLFTATSLSNPVNNGTNIVLNASKKILNASTQTYSDDWRIISNYKEKSNDSCCNEIKWYEKINKIYNDHIK